MNKRKAVVAGLVCLDITPIFSNRKGNDIREVLKPGKLINVDQAQIYSGGAVSNTGQAMKKMGVDTCLIGKIGDDPFGDIIYSIYQEYDGHYDLILHHGGVNDCFGCKDIDDSKLEGADLFHLGYPPALKQLYQNEGDELLEIFSRVDQKGLITSLDMMAIEPGSPASETDWQAVLKKVLPFVDYFVPSFEELCYILDRDKYELLSEKAGHGDITEVLSVEDDIRPPTDCLLAAAATGTSCVEAYDVLSGVRPVKEQLQRIQSGLKKQKLIQ